VNVVVIGAGPAGVMAALRAAELGATTTLLTRAAFGGMAANDGPVPVRTLAHAARLLRSVAQYESYGLGAASPVLDYRRVLERTREVAEALRERSHLRAEVTRLGVAVQENVGTVRFLDAHTVEAENGLRARAERILLCAGGIGRRLAVPGAERTAMYRDAWELTEIPASLLVVGGGMTGLQVASIFHAFGSRVQVFERGPRILPAEDEEVAREVTAGLRALGIEIHELFGTIDGFEPASAGTRMVYTKDGVKTHAEASLIVTAVGWAADTAGLDLPAAGIAVDPRGFVQTDECLATSVPHVFAAGDITGRTYLVPPAVLDAHVAATNAVLGEKVKREEGPIPMGGFTDPEYAHVGLTEAEAKRGHEVVVGVVRFEETARATIDGRAAGFCKLIADRATRKLLGCHVVGERAAEIVQAAAMAMAGGLDVADLARMPLAFPTYVGTLSRAAYRAWRQVDPAIEGPAHLEER